MPNPHDKIIAAEARRTLSPLRFVRKGRSRLWLADHRWWLNVVEFTPSRWSKGAYVTNSAHWLFAGKGHVTFDFHGEKRPRLDFFSEEQFTAEMPAMAELAASQAKAIEDKHRDAQAIYQFITKRASDGTPMSTSWWSYQAGIVSILMGKVEDAVRYLAAIDDERVIPHAEDLLAVGRDGTALTQAVLQQIHRHRKALGLPLNHDLSL